MTKKLVLSEISTGLKAEALLNSAFVRNASTLPVLLFTIVVPLSLINNSWLFCGSKDIIGASSGVFPAYLVKSSTKFSVARYSCLGSIIKLYLSNEQIYVRVFTSGEINISYYDTFYGTETRKEISPKFTDGTYTENEVKLMIKETKKFIRESLR